MNKITYLFGAGASKNSLPIVEEIPDRIKQQIQFLSKGDFILDDKTNYSDIGVNKTHREIQLEMIHSLEWMMEKSSNHASIDTFAKKLFIKGDEENLKKLKITMSLFFVIEQLRTKPDLRYDAFFASIINKANRLPGNVRVISWNYDSQFEMAYSEYTENYISNHNQMRLNLKFKHSRTYDNTMFGIYKLNGTTGFIDNKLADYHFLHQFNSEINKNFLSDLCRRYAIVLHSRNYYSTLSFSWERGNDSNYDIVRNSVASIADSNILVVIGYSFPFFNREVDSEIINGMTNLKKVYFQSLEPGNLIERFKALRNSISGVEMISINDVKQFYLPKEL